MGRNRKPAKAVKEILSRFIDFVADLPPPRLFVPKFRAEPQDFSRIVANVVRLSSEQQNELIDQQGNNPYVLAALGMYGGVEQRKRVFDMLDHSQAGLKDFDANHLVRVYFEGNSLDFYLHKAQKEAARKASNLSNVTPEEREAAYQKFSDDYFENQFMYRWVAVGYTPPSTRTGWAMLHYYMSQVGPNAEVPPPMDFFPEYEHLKGYVPKLNPEVVQTLQRLYEKHQAILIAKGVPEVVTLYRGTHQPRGLPLESFTTIKKVAEEFAQNVPFSGPRNGQGEVRRERIPRKYIFGSWQTFRGWPEDEVLGRHEHLVMGTSFYANEQRLRRQGRASSIGAQFKLGVTPQSVKGVPRIVEDERIV